MDAHTTVKYLNKEETKEALKNAKQEGVLSSQTVDTLPKYEQERIKNLFLNTFRDDRSAYHKYMYDKEYAENMKAKEKKQIISDEEEKKILEEYTKEKDKKILKASTKAKEHWKNNKQELPDVVVNFD